MNAERHVLEVFDRANPVPDPELLQVGTDASKFLADLLENPSAIRFEPAARPRTAHRRRWRLPAIAAAVVAFVVAGLAVVVRDDSTDREPADTPPATVPDIATVAPVPATIAVPSTTVAPSTVRTDNDSEVSPAATVTAPSATSPKVSEFLGPDAASLGESVLLDSGHLARVNSFVEDAPIRNSFDAPTLDAASITEIEVERCIGEEPPDYPEAATGVSWWGLDLAPRWSAVLDDGRIIEGRPGHYPPLVLQPGGCFRGFIAFPTPRASTVVGVSWAYDSGGLLGTANWELSKSQPSDGPLHLPISPPAVEFGEPMTVELGLDVVDVTVVEIIDNAEPKPSWTNIARGTPVEPPAPGRKKVEIRAQVCDDPSQGNTGWPREVQWFIVTDDNYIGTAETFDNPDRKRGGSDSFPTSDVVDSARGHFYASSLVFDDQTGTDRYNYPPPGECAVGYVQIDLPSEATPTDVVIALGDAAYWELGRTRLNT